MCVCTYHPCSFRKRWAKTRFIISFGDLCSWFSKLQYNNKNVTTCLWTHNYATIKTTWNINHKTMTRRRCLRHWRFSTIVTRLFSCPFPSATPPPLPPLTLLCGWYKSFLQRVRNLYVQHSIRTAFKDTYVHLQLVNNFIAPKKLVNLTIKSLDHFH